MAKICFTWELGQGFGHLVRYMPLIGKLLDGGDEVWFLAKDAARARTVFAGMPLHIEQVEPGITPTDKALAHLNSYPEILYNFGFFAADVLAAQLQPWLEKFTAISPDLLVVDHSPTVLLANRVRNIPMISSGSGFTVPPRSTPMKPLRYWSLRQRERLAANERHVLDVCNEVLRHSKTVPLTQFSDLLAADCEWLLTFAELDHYGVRDGARYLGSFPATDFGEPPRWSDSPGPKVFAYLSTRAVSDSFAEAVRELGVNLCLYAPILEPVEMSKFVPERTCRCASPVNLDLAATQCRAAVTNASLNTVSAFLRAGTAQLALPNNMERYMVGRRLELAGAGLVAPRSRQGNVTAKLYAVLYDRAFGRAASSFARLHAGDNAENQLTTMLVDIDRLLQRDVMGLRG